MLERMVWLSKILVLALWAIGLPALHAQKINILDSGTKTSIRGLSVVDERIIWVSGSNGTVGLSGDSGRSFKWITVKGFEQTDFRDIEAFDETTAVIMGIASPAYILRTVDGGESWNIVYENKGKSMFLDAMEFQGDKNGIVIGDPADGKFFLAHTNDGGRHWTEQAPYAYPLVDTGEACFASSGTNIRNGGATGWIFVSGGKQSHLFMAGKKMAIPMLKGKETTGANSFAVNDRGTIITVGGDFTDKEAATKNCFITKNEGKDWAAPAESPHGYRSCVEWLSGRQWISCGLNGVDYTDDDGDTWKWISKESFHVCRKAKKGKAVFLAGNNGRIARLTGL